MIGDYNETETTSLDFDIKFCREENGMYSCHIPLINAYFSAMSESDMENCGRAMILSFINYWNRDNKKI